MSQMQKWCSVLSVLSSIGPLTQYMTFQSHFNLCFQVLQQINFLLVKQNACILLIIDLSSYFSGELLRSIKHCGSVIVCINEALNKIVQKCQMDITIRYYDNDINKVALRYFSSSLLGSSSAKDILESFLESVNKLNIEPI